MLIDWFTVGAQALNFIILVWLLRRFLYQPVLQALAAREQTVAAQLLDAVTKRTAADHDGAEYRQKSKALDDAREAELDKTRTAGSAERAQLMAAARSEAEALRKQLTAAMRDAQLQLSTQISVLARHEVFAIARKALADLAATSLEERMSDVLARRLQNLDGAAKKSLATALESDRTAVVRSTFEMSPAERATLQDALNRTLSADIPLHFEAAASSICGIELDANGYKLSWSIAEYLTTLEQNVAARALAGATAS